MIFLLVNKIHGVNCQFWVKRSKFNLMMWDRRGGCQRGGCKNATHKTFAHNLPNSLIMKDLIVWFQTVKNCYLRKINIPKYTGDCWKIADSDSNNHGWDSKHRKNRKKMIVLRKGIFLFLKKYFSFVIRQTLVS